MEKKIRSIKFYLMVLVLMGFSTLMAGSAIAGDGVIEIKQTAATTFPIVLDGANGKSYILTSDITVTDPNVNAFNINVDGITLNLNGFMVKGPGSGSGNGIKNDTNIGAVCIKNGTVRDFYTGISISGGISAAKGTIIKNIQAINNTRHGIEGTGCIITECCAYGNGLVGIGAQYSNIIGNDVGKNGSDGISVWYSNVKDNLITSNDTGVFSGWGSKIEGNCITKNVKDGISSAASYILNNNIYENGRWGIRSNHDSRIINNLCKDNGSDGIYINSDGNHIEGNTLINNAGYGLLFRESETNTAENNYYLKNTYRGNTAGAESIPPGNKDGGTVDPALSNVSY